MTIKRNIVKHTLSDKEIVIPIPKDFVYLRAVSIALTESDFDRNRNMILLDSIQYTVDSFNKNIYVSTPIAEDIIKSLSINSSFVIVVEYAIQT